MTKMERNALLLGGLLSLTCVGGCSNGGGDVSFSSDGQEIVCNLPDYDAKADELSISIGGWVVPNDLTDEQYQYMKDSGIDTYFFASAGKSSYSINVNDIKENDKNVLAKMEEYGLDAILHVGGKNAATLPNIANVKQFNAVKGLCFDEPDKSQIGEIRNYLGKVNENAGTKTLFTNLYPSLAESVRSDFERYEDYLAFYCDNVLSKLTVGEKWLSADRYPLTFDGKGQPVLDNGWLRDIEAVAVTARTYEDVKTNFFIQTMAYGGANSPAGMAGSRARVPSYEDVRLQEYTLMAFGYDMISCFCYGSPVLGAEFTEAQEAMIDRDGNRTQVYYNVAKANKEIKAFDHVVKQFDWKGVFTNDAGRTTTDKGRTQNASFSNLVNRMSIESIDCLKKVFSTQDTLFSYMVDFEDNAGFMVVNYNDSSLKLTDEVTMTFDASYGYKKALCYVGGEKKVMDITDNALTFTLGVGEGIFVIPY